MKKTTLLKTMLLLCALVVGSMNVWADPIISWSRSSSTDTYTTGYTFATAATSKTDYYQDGGEEGAERSLKLYHTSTALFSKTPSSVTFTAKVGGGTGDKDLSNSVYVCFVDKTGAVIDGTATIVTSHITTNTGDNYNISMPTAKATQAYGVKIYHTKESGYNVRYYSFSLSAVIPSKDLIGTFDEIDDIEIAVGANQTFNASDYFTIDGSATESATLSVTPAYGSGTHAYFNEGKIYATSYGTEEFTITATPAAADEENFAEATKTFNVKVLKVPDLSGITDESIAYGETLEVSAASAGALTLTSGNTSVATVSETVLTGIAVGTSTITVNSAKNSEYVAGSTTFVLTVTAPTGSSSKPSASPVIVFEETFAGCSSTGGNDGNFATAGSGEISTPDDYTDNAGWSFTKGYPGKACAKFGGSSPKGSATSPTITVENGKTYTLSFKAAPWSSETSKTITVAVTGGTIDTKSSATTTSMTTGEWNDFEFDVVASSTSISFNFSCSANRFFLDEVKLTKPGTPITKTSVTIAASGYGSYCYDYPLTMPNTADCKAYIVTAANKDAVTFTQITGDIKGGVPFILFGTPGSHDVNLPDASSTEYGSNMLVGTLAPTYVETESGLYTNFGLSGGSFKKINSGTIPAHKAYLPVLTSALSGGSGARLDIVFEDESTTGIKFIRHEVLNSEEYYNLAGQRVAQPKKGLYIMNGKKVIIK